MEWFNDQPLRPRPHIAVLFYDALGDFVIITPLLRGLKEKYPRLHARLLQWRAHARVGGGVALHRCAFLGVR
jgi:ADP-heptose:LPS heptosyltransferase